MLQSRKFEWTWSSTRSWTPTGQWTIHRLNPFSYFNVLSLHLFKNYGKSNKCIDMELTYFLECTSLAKTNLSKTGFEDICRANGKFSLSSNEHISTYSVDMITVNHIITPKCLTKDHPLKTSPHQKPFQACLVPIVTNIPNIPDHQCDQYSTL